MRIKSVSLSWFRGASARISLEPGCKSIVIYGANGAGKSSFVDAIGYALSDGRIGHLAHEYSGKKQEHAVPNTHKPTDTLATFSIEFCDGTAISSEINNDGSTSTSGSAHGWNYRRTVLRQGEVVDFIQDTKGGKYSALLPLFGLQPMEIAAENLRQLGRNIDSLSQLESRRTALQQTSLQRNAVFGTANNDTILQQIEALHEKYCIDKSPSNDVESLCSESVAAIDVRITQLSAEGKRHIALRSAGESNLTILIDTVRNASNKLAVAIDPLITHKLAVLQRTEEFVWKLTGDGLVGCPACGQPIRIPAFQEHVVAELER